jgi:DNA-binding response OmpR family regulator
MARLQTIVLVEGMKPVEERLAPILTHAGYHTVTAGTKKGALAKVEEARPAVILVDAPSLRFNGLRFLGTLGEARFGVPILALLPEGRPPADVASMASYLCYPFSHRKLTKRISELLMSVIQVGDVIFNVAEGTLAYHRDLEPLTPKQARLLEVFMRHPGQVLTRAFLMKQVWDTDYLGDTRTLDVHVRWVRKAVEKDPGSPQYLCTVRGVGYRFDALDE